MPADNVVKLKPTRPCPICGKPSAQQFHPFCSGRCADIDLNRWLKGAYVIPGRSLLEQAGEGDPGDGPPGAPADDDEG
jgi:uncharacterized protein